VRTDVLFKLLVVGLKLAAKGAADEVFSAELLDQNYVRVRNLNNYSGSYFLVLKRFKVILRRELNIGGNILKWCQ
jgi:hypothetical protein